MKTLRLQRQLSLAIALRKSEGFHDREMLRCISNARYAWCRLVALIISTMPPLVFTEDATRRLYQVDLQGMRYRATR